MSEELKSNELECPICYGMVDVSETEKYELVDCHVCEVSLEFIGDELIKPEELEDE